MRTLLIGAAALAAAALTPTAAAASTVALEGDVLVVRTGDAGAHVIASGASYIDDRLELTTQDEPITSFPDTCGRMSFDHDDTVRCTVPAALRVEGGAGDDDLRVTDQLPAGFPVTVLGGGGNDMLVGRPGDQRDRYDGGAGDDVLDGGAAPEVLDGGDGNDQVWGDEGADEVRGGPGDDEVIGDEYHRAYADVVDGGPGTDRSVNDWMENRIQGPEQPYVTVTLDGQANDGRPGENDDVRSIEVIEFNDGATFVAGGDPLSVTIREVSDGGSKLIGGPAEDDLRSPDSNDVIDGRGGNDRIEGGNGADRIIGGPGRDDINAEAGSGSCNFLVCRLPHGNDVVKVRDGERDTVTCGAGRDRVFADRKDVIAGDCERVKRR